MYLFTCEKNRSSWSFWNEKLKFKDPLGYALLKFIIEAYVLITAFGSEYFNLHNHSLIIEFFR